VVAVAAPVRSEGRGEGCSGPARQESFKTISLINHLAYSDSDRTSDITTSHLTDETTSQSTKPPKNGGKVAGYNPAKGFA
jgi:hypothetical protein